MLACPYHYDRIATSPTRGTGRLIWVRLTGAGRLNLQQAEQ